MTDMLENFDEFFIDRKCNSLAMNIKNVMYFKYC